MKQALLVFVLGAALFVPLGGEAQSPCQNYCTDLNVFEQQMKACIQEHSDEDNPREHCQEHEGIVPPDSPPDFTCICNPLQSDDFTGIVNNILTFLFNVALVVSPLMVVVAGIMFVSAAGDPARVTRAKQILIWTAVGFGIILLAQGLVTVLRGIIGF